MMELRYRRFMKLAENASNMSWKVHEVPWNLRWNWLCTSTKSSYQRSSTYDFSVMANIRWNPEIDIHTPNTWHDWQLNMENCLVLKSCDVSNPVIVEWIKFQYSWASTRNWWNSQWLNEKSNEISLKYSLVPFYLMLKLSSFLQHA